jgi:hypothetical protein
VQGSSDTGIGVFASTSGNGTAIFGQLLSTEPAVRGQNFGSGIGVRGQSTDGHGVSGETNQAGRAGVIGANASTSSPPWELREASTAPVAVCSVTAPWGGVCTGTPTVTAPA